jgi:hypothetical protein
LQQGGFYITMADSYYFSHDYNARSDDKIKALIRKHGMTGYGIFWSIIEDLYNNANALRTDSDGIAYDLRTDSEVIKSILFDFDLFVFDGDNFGSLSVQKRLDERDIKSRKASESARKRWDGMRTHSERNTNAMQSESEGNAIKERKGKEIKDIKEIKGKDIKPHLFSESIYFDFALFEKEFENTDYAVADLRMYYESVKNWSESEGAKKLNWIATARNFIIGDLKQNKLIYKNGTTQSQKQSLDVKAKRDAALRAEFEKRRNQQ